MIIETQEDVTKAVLAGMKDTPDPRIKSILESLVRHLHGFIRETRLTEREFQQAVGHVVALGQKTTPSHNEVMLISGALGVSNLVCLLNNGQGGTAPTQANNLGPFWREGAPRCKDGESLLRSPVEGPPLFFNGRVVDTAGNPVAGAEIDVWHSTPDGLYENQDPKQAEMNLRGVFETQAADGRFSFRSVRPAGYPVPIDGPTGALIKAQNRHNFRPAHLHFLIYKPGYKTIASQVYPSDDPHLETDSQFAVTKALVAHYELREGPAPAADVKGPWYSLEFEFTIEPGEAKRPKAPISAKAK